MEQVEFEFTFLADSGAVHFVQCFRSGKTGKEREPGIDVTGAPNRDGGVLVRSPVDRVTVSLCV